MRHGIYGDIGQKEAIDNGCCVTILLGEKSLFDRAHGLQGNVAHAHPAACGRGGGGLRTGTADRAVPL